MKPPVDGVRVRHPHQPGCSMLRDFPDNPLYMPSEVHVSADSIGRPRRGQEDWEKVEKAFRDAYLGGQVRAT